MKLNNFFTGIILGILSPFIGVLIFYLWKAGSTPFGYFLEIMINEKPLLTAATSFSLLLNAIVFTVCVNTKKDQTAKGVFLVTLIITVPAIIYKLFFR